MSKVSQTFPETFYFNKSAELTFHQLKPFFTKFVKNPLRI